MSRLNALTIALVGLCAGLLGADLVRTAEAAPMRKTGTTRNGGSTFDSAQRHTFDDFQRWTEEQVGVATLCICLETGANAGRMGWIHSYESGSNKMFAKCWLPHYGGQDRTNNGGGTCRNFAVIR